MLLFLDTANLDEIKEIASWGVLGGITTNPSLVSKEHQDFKKLVQEICRIVDGPVSAEVTSTDPKEMIKQGLAIATWAKNVVVKCPLTPAGLTATNALHLENIPVNVTLCFSVNQALLAAAAGATYVSPFIGRLDDINEDGCSLVEQIVETFHMQGIATKVLAASIRTPQQVMRVALAGAACATMPYKIFKQLVNHPLTASGQEKFLADWRQATAAQAVLKA